MKFLILIAFLVLLYWYFFIKKKRKLSFNKAKELIEELVFDENCKIYIKKDEAIKVKIKDKTYYFCSKKCLHEFLQKTSKPQS